MRIKAGGLLPVLVLACGLSATNLRAQTEAAPPLEAQAPVPGPEAAPPVDLGSPVVEALEIVARPPGPALWKVTRGEAEVVVLGGVTPLPHALVWDTARVDRALDGARVLLVPPKPKVGVFDLLKFAVSGQNKVRQAGGKPMEESLPLKLRERFVGARTAALKEAGRYARWKPFLAGFILVNDYRAAAGLSSAKPGSTVEKLAEKRKVPVRAVADYRLAPLLKQAGAIDEKASLACLDDAVSQVETESDHAQALAKAWAAGDLYGVKANYAPPPLERCLQGVPSVAALMERGTADSARAILTALEKPGRSVAVVDLNYLLRPNGVLDRLKAAGAQVSLPPA